MSSLYRLISLAKRTGDRLIVHNPIDNQDVVIMSVDQYEELLDDGGVNPNFPEDEPPMGSPDGEYEPEGPTRAGDILSRRYPDAEYFSYGDQSVGEETGEAPGEDFSDFPDDQESEAVSEEVQEVIPEPKKEEPKEVYIPRTQSVPDEPVLPEPVIEKVTSNIPSRQGNGNLSWEEEPLSPDEPVFYEEPVN